MSLLTSPPTSSGPGEKISRRRPWRAKAAGVIAAALAVTTAVASPAPAADNPYERGPAPTTASIEASRGSFATSTATVSRLSVSGFGGGTIYYPTTTTAGTFGAISIAPGFTATQSSMAWLGPRLASQGFVVFTIDTLTTSDQPDSRGRQLLASLDYLTQQSSVRSRIDSSRLGVVGHSMGGGGTLEAARSRPSLQAAVPLTGWNLTKSWSTVRVPTLVVGAEADTIAPVATHSIPFYTSLPSSLDKAYLELRGASHFAPNSSNTTIAKYTLSWLKRFIDNDTRYEQFLCPIPGTSLSISDYRGNCPHNG
ncbi:MULTISPECIES: dienelactone hydrolase family protein [unclassified Amycolatopsis]|uniref:bis(hydroxyethyl) terephthalate hydrolase n=1 Tax=unclassified Amycolatopsis TaxID=2618356 RepID=UPI001FF2C97E|nr:dienelactone hydrolase family protein [Amycolatopsis sp. FBCC-B4732]UOX89143.1 dienelactone hydrolase family protein [Amycolatopsis sp. FBCC-B4732]